MFRLIDRGDLTGAKKLYMQRPESIYDECVSNAKPIHRAAAYNRTEFIKWLCALNPTFTCHMCSAGRSPLHYAACTGSAEALELLYQLDSTQLDRRDSSGSTPMDSAARMGHWKIVEKLHELGSKTMDVLDNSGYAPMHSAAVFCKSAVIITLHRLGSEAWFSMDFLERSNVDPDSACAKVANMARRLYFSRSLMENLFFVSDAISPVRRQ